MTNEEAKLIKYRCLENIRIALTYVDYARIDKIDVRMVEYINDCIRTDIDTANLYELLGIRKFLRMFCTYELDIDKVKRIYSAYEHLKFSGINGKQFYRLTPLQVFELAGPFLFKKDGKRIVTEANYFIPRKSSKTTLAAFFIFWFFFFEDYNAEAYCTANSSDQSKILFNLSSDLIRQMDPKGEKIRFTATEISWYDHSIRESKVCALSAGGKTKDGLFAQLCCADEYGSAGYVKDHSDMANLVNVVEGSMGPRREPMTVITTTAGRVQSGPYQIKLEGIKQSLLEEMEYDLDGEAHEGKNDWQFALLCCPDQWEEDDDSLMQPNVWRKVNRHIGVTVQEDYYRKEWEKMLQDPEKKKEQITKLFNVWQTDRVKTWMSGSDIQPLMTDCKITDLSTDNGWVCFVGADFSKGDDLNAISYLAYNTEKKCFFADMDAWISEDSLNNNGNSTLYRLWAEQGHLRVCKGKTIDETEVTNRIIEVSNCLTILRIGYDAYDAKRFINAIGAYIFSLGQDPNVYLRPVSQSFGATNSPVQELDYMIKADPALIHFSKNPLWLWEFGNAMLEEDKFGNLRPKKSSANAKIDNVQALIDAIVLYDEMQGKIV